MKEIIITKNEAGQRLDKLLLKYLNTAPKSFIYKMLRKKNIKLNKTKATGNELLVEGDVVHLFLADDTVDNFRENKSIATESLPDYDLDIIYEDEDVLFVNKPVGMLSQKADKTDVSINEHIVNYCANKYDNDLFVPSVCNRLDRNTSGLILAGISLAGSQELSKLLKDRTLDKYYVTIVKGVITESKLIEGYLHKDEVTNKVSFSTTMREGYMPIQTMYEPIEHNSNYTYLRVKLITGKTHQIRAHLASIGHPIIGDNKYGNVEDNRYFSRTYKLKYQLLHAQSIVFPRMTGKLERLSKKSFTADLPSQFTRVYNDLFR